MKYEKLGATHFASGMNLTAAEESLPSGKLARSINAIYTKDNRVGPRKGLLPRLNVADVLRLIVPMKQDNGDEWLALVSDAAINIVDHLDILDSAYTAPQATKTIAEGQEVTATTLQGDLWWGGDASKRLYFYDPETSLFFLAGILEATDTPTVATGAAGVLSGRYKYKFGYGRKVGTRVATGNLSPESAEVAPAAQKVSVAGLIAWAGHGTGSTLYIDVYRSKFIREDEAFDVFQKCVRLTQQTIGSVVNATPIVINLTAHGYYDTQTVYVSEVGGTTNANGPFTITFINANSFSLNGSVGNGAYTGGGKVIATRFLDNATDVSIAANQTEEGLDGEPPDEIEYVESIYDFLVVANRKDRVSVARVLLPEQFPAASFIDLDAGQSQHGPLVASLADRDRVYFWKRDATYMIGPGQADMVPPMERVVIDRTRGTVNRHAPKSTPAGVVTPGDENIWLLQGQNYVPIGGDILAAYLDIRESDPIAFNGMFSFIAHDITSYGLIIGERIFLLDYTKLPEPHWYEWQFAEGVPTCAVSFTASIGLGLLYFGVNIGPGEEGCLALNSGDQDIGKKVKMTLRTGRIGNVEYSLYRRAILRTDGSGSFVFRTFSLGKQKGEDKIIPITGAYDSGQVMVKFKAWAPALQVEIETEDTVVRDLVLLGRAKEIQRSRRIA